MSHSGGEQVSIGFANGLVSLRFRAFGLWFRVQGLGLGLGSR